MWLASGFYIVDEGRRGVVTRFGKYTETTQPGPRWHLPFPVESVELVNVSQVKTVEVGYRNTPKNKVEREALMLTDDENIVDIQFAVQYTLKSAEDYLFNVRRPDQTVACVAETAMREVVGKAKMDFVLYEGREQIAKSTEKLMQEILDRYKTGIYVQKVTLQNVQPPEQVQAAFDDAVKAGQDRERFRNEGQAYANDVVPKARGNASRLHRGGERLPGRGRADRRGRRLALPPDPGRVHEGARRHARAPLPRHDAVGSRQHQQGDGRPEGRQQHLLYLPLDKLIQQSVPPTAPPRRRPTTAGCRAARRPATEPAAAADARPLARGAAHPRTRRESR